MKKIILLIMMVLICAGGRLKLSASSGVKAMDAVLVHDVSGSMFRSDPTEISLDAMKMFVDLCDYGRARVGMVTFSNIIEDTMPLTPIDDLAGKTQVKDHINKMKFTGRDTDVGLALRTAADILETSGKAENSRFIVLLSDGKTDLPRNSSRTIRDSQDDVASVINDASTYGYPIYTIGLNFDGSVDAGELTEIAEKTGGIYYETNKSSNLTAILQDIFARHSGVANDSIADYDADGTLQTIEISIPDSTVLAANIVVTAPQGIKQAHIFNPNGQEIPIPSDKLLFSSGLSYNLYKVILPEKGIWKLQIQGVDKDNITVDLIMSRDFILDINAVTDLTSNSITITSFLSDMNAQNINDDEIYSTSTATAYITDKTDNTTQEISMTYQNMLFQAGFNFVDGHDYQISTRLVNGYLNFSSATLDLSTSQTPTQTTSQPPTPTQAPTQTPTQTTSQTQAPAPTEPQSDTESKSVLLPIIAALIVLLIVAAIILILLTKGNLSRPVFTYGKLSFSFNAASLNIPPFVWSFEQLSYKKRIQPLTPILENICDRNGIDTDFVMDKKTSDGISFSLHKSGALLMSENSGALNITNADSAGKNLYLLYDNVPAVLYLDNGNKITIRFIED